METLLFTGGTGFLGKNIRPVLDKRYKVTTCGIAPIDDIKINLAKEIPVSVSYTHLTLPTNSRV